MSSIKRKAEEAVPDVEKDAKKRAKKDEVSDHEGEEALAAVGSEDEESVDDDELAGLDKANVIDGGRRTRGVRIDYSNLKDDEDEQEDSDEEDEEGGEGDGDEGDGEPAVEEVAYAGKGEVHEGEDTPANEVGDNKNGYEEEDEEDEV